MCVGGGGGVSVGVCLYECIYTEYQEKLITSFEQLLKSTASKLKILQTDYPAPYIKHILKIQLVAYKCQKGEKLGEITQSVLSNITESVRLVGSLQGTHKRFHILPPK